MLTTFCVTKDTPIHFIDSKCHIKFNQSHRIYITPYQDIVQSSISTCLVHHLLSLELNHMILYVCISRNLFFDNIYLTIILWNIFLWTCILFVKFLILKLKHPYTVYCIKPSQILTSYFVRIRSRCCHVRSTRTLHNQLANNTLWYEASWRSMDSWSFNDIRSLVKYMLLETQSSAANFPEQQKVYICMYK